MQKTVTFSLDKYSKIVLTAIAVCLVLIVVNMYFSPVKLNASETVMDVNIKSVNGSSLWGNEIPIDLKKVSTNNDLSIDLHSINGRNIFGDKLPVDIQSINGQFIFGGKIPVDTR